MLVLLAMGVEIFQLLDFAIDVYDARIVKDNSITTYVRVALKTSRRAILGMQLKVRTAYLLIHWIMSFKHLWTESSSSL